MEYLSTMEKSKSYMYKCKKPHHSIVTSLEKAKYCLGKSSHLECPLCPEDKFKPTFTSKVKSHLDSHGEYGSGVRLNPDCVVLTCHLPTCKQTMSKEYPTNKDFGKKSQTKKDGHGHYHCPDCGNILARKSNFRSHMESQHNYSLPDPVASKQKAGNKRKSDTTKISVEETGSPGHTKERSSGPTEEMGSPGVAQEMEVTGLTEEVRLGSLRDLTALKENGFSHLTLQNIPQALQPVMTNVEMSCSTQTTDKISHPSMNDTEMSYSTQTTRIVSHPSLNDVEMSCSTQTTDKISQSLLNDTEMSYLIQTTRIVSQLSVNDVEMSCSTLTTDKTSQPPSNDMEMSYLTPTTHIVPQLSLNDTEMSCSTQTTDNSNDAYSHGRSNFTRNHEINANLLQMQEVDLQPDIPAKIRKCSDEIDLQACILDEDMLYYFKHDIPMTGPSKHVLSGDENDEGYTNSLSETLEDKHVIENTDISDLVDYLNNKKSWEDLEKAEPGSMQTWDTGYFSEVEMQEI